MLALIPKSAAEKRFIKKFPNLHMLKDVFKCEKKAKLALKAENVKLEKECELYKDVLRKLKTGEIKVEDYEIEEVA